MSDAVAADLLNALVFYVLVIGGGLGVGAIVALAVQLTQRLYRRCRVPVRWRGECRRCGYSTVLHTRGDHWCPECSKLLYREPAALTWDFTPLRKRIHSLIER